MAHLMPDGNYVHGAEAKGWRRTPDRLKLGLRVGAIFKMPRRLGLRGA